MGRHGPGVRVGTQGVRRPGMGERFPPLDAGTLCPMDAAQSGYNRANSVAPLLVSSRQGLGKSTFCRLLMPDRLKSYYTESYDLSSPASAEAKLAAYGLINLDEFDKLGASKMPLLKNLMQASALNIRKAYKHSASSLPRIASFIGTSNRRICW